MPDDDENSQSGIDPSKQIGYRKPPKATRFKKGQSGNPKGRRKGSLNVSTIFAQTLREKVVVNENGRRKTMTKFEAAIKQFVNKAASGDHRALQLLLTLSREVETSESLSISQRSTLNEVDKKVMDGFLKRLEKTNLSKGVINNDPNQQ